MEVEKNHFIRYFRVSPHVFLWWFGGLITCVWCYLLALAAYGLTYYDDAPSGDDFIIYMTALTFCVGARGVGKALQNQEGIKNDRLRGEVWYILVLVLTGIILLDHFSPWTIFDHVEKIPEQLFWTNVGTASLLTGSKVFKMWDAIKWLTDKIGQILKI